LDSILIPAVRYPEECKIDQDRQCRGRFDYKASEAFANVIGRHSGEDLMRAIKHSSNDRVPEPGSHSHDSSL